MKRIIVIGISALLSAGTGHVSGQTRSPSFQYVAKAGGDLAGSQATYTAHRGSRQLLYFSNDKLTIAATIEVEDISAGVARLKAMAQSYPGKVDRETSERELKSALQPKSGVKFAVFVQMSRKIRGCSRKLCSSRSVFTKVGSAFQWLQPVNSMQYRLYPSCNEW